MTLEHRCTFCGFNRGGGPATLLDPYCDRCGCVLEALPAPVRTTRAAQTELRAVAARRMALVALLLGIVPLVLVAAKLGYGQGGAPLAAGAAGAASLLLYVFLAPAPH